jgi:hypothetical protein
MADKQVLQHTELLVSLLERPLALTETTRATLGLRHSGGDLPYKHYHGHRD